MPWGLEFQPTLWPVKGLSHGCGRELSAGRRSGFPASCHGRDWAEIFGNHAATWIWLPSESLRQLNIDPEHKNYFLVDTHLLTPIWQGPWRVLSSLNICCCCFFLHGSIHNKYGIYCICYLLFLFLLWQRKSQARFRTFFVQMGDLCWNDGPALSCAVDEAGTSWDLVCLGFGTFGTC